MKILDEAGMEKVSLTQYIRQGRHEKPLFTESARGVGIKKVPLSSFKGGFPLGEMSGDFAAKFIWACAFLFVYSLAGKIFLLKIVQIDLTNSQRKNLLQMFDQSKRKYIPIFAFTTNTFESDQNEGGC